MDQASLTDYFIKKLKEKGVISAEALSPEEERALAVHALEGGVDSRNRLLNNALPAVAEIACRYAGRGISLIDLFSTGCMGLIHALERYDPDTDVSFSVFAAPVVLLEIVREVTEAGAPLSLRRRFREYLVRIEVFSDGFEQQNGRRPTPEEISDGTGMPLKNVRALLSLPKERPYKEDFPYSYDENVGLRKEIDDFLSTIKPNNS